jgi:4-aminobutyrate aminotransferase-like enzyme
MSESLVGEHLFAAPEVEKLITQLVQQVTQHSEQIKTVRGPNPEHQASAAMMIETIGKNRGRPLFYPFVGSGIGRGPYVELQDGSVKLDLINGIGINVLGHSHPQVTKAALRGALSDIVMQGNLEPNKEYMELGAELVKLASKSSRLRHAWVTTCGTMANENAIKIARQKKTPARMILALEGAFAGRSTLMAEVTDNPANRVGLPEYHEVLRVPYCNKYTDMCKTSCGKDKALARMKEHVAKHEGDICAFVFEPMIGEGGYRVACRDYFIPMLEFCKSKGIPVWADEIQTFSRTGQFFAFETMGFGQYVDICTLAKTALNGATLYTEEYNPQPGLIAGTFAGATSALSAGLETLKILQDGYMGPNGKIQKVHEKFLAMLNRLNTTTCKDLLRDAEGMGLMVAVTPLDGSKEKVAELLNVLFKNGLMIFNCGKGPFRLRFLLPAILTETDIELAGKILEKSILELA